MNTAWRSKRRRTLAGQHFQTPHCIRIPRGILRHSWCATFKTLHRPPIRCILRHQNVRTLKWRKRRAPADGSALFVHFRFGVRIQSEPRIGDGERPRPACKIGRSAQSLVSQFLPLFSREKVSGTKFSASRRKQHASGVRSPRGCTVRRRCFAVRVQCRKWRAPVKTIATLRALAAAMTSASRSEPPG